MLLAAEEAGRGYVTTNQLFKLKTWRHFCITMNDNFSATLLLTYHDRALVAFGEREDMSLIYTFA